MHFLFSLLRMKVLYMFRALLAHPQEALHKRHLVYCVHVTSVGCTSIGVEIHSNSVCLSIYLSIYHCCTSQKIAGSIPDVRMFHWLNPSGRTLDPGSTQPVTEMSTSGVCWGVKAAGA
jgi:hypothetical protein